MPQLKTIIETRLKQVLSEIEKIKEYETVTEAQLISSHQQEVALEAARERLRQAKEAREQLKKRKVVTTSLDAACEALRGEISQAEKIMTVSLSLLDKSIAQARVHLQVITDAFPEIERGSSRLPVLQRTRPGFRKYLADTGTLLDALEGISADIGAKVKTGQPCAASLKELAEWLASHSTNRVLVESIIKALSDIGTTVEQTNVYRGYRVVCTPQSLKNLQEPTYLQYFKSKFDKIIRGWAMVNAPGNTSQSWWFIPASRVARGEISGNLRIIYELRRGELVIYEFFTHKEYDKLLPALKAGQYNMNQQLKPLQAFYEFEAAA